MGKFPFNPDLNYFLWRTGDNLSFPRAVTTSDRNRLWRPLSLWLPFVGCAEMMTDCMVTSLWRVSIRVIKMVINTQTAICHWQSLHTLALHLQQQKAIAWLAWCLECFHVNKTCSNGEHLKRKALLNSFNENQNSCQILFMRTPCRIKI